MVQIIAAMRPPVQGTREPLILRKSIPVYRFQTHFVCYDTVIIPRSDEQNVSGVGNIGEQKTAAV